MELSYPITNKDDIFMALSEQLTECMLDSTQEFFWWVEETDHVATHPKLAATVDELCIKLAKERGLKLKPKRKGETQRATFTLRGNLHEL